MQVQRELGEGSRIRAFLLTAVVLAALVVRLLPSGAQDQIAWVARSTVLRPFLDLKWTITELRATSTEVDELYATIDSLMEAVAAQATLIRDNQTLSELMALQASSPRMELVPARLARPGGQGRESVFMIDRGLDQGVGPGAPVISVRGLLGRVVQARGDMATGIDWTHPDFRVSAMVEDGRAFGIVYVDRGSFREADRMVLDGLAYHSETIEGMDVVTSGLGGVFPRGIKIGTVIGIREERVPWARSYWLRPTVEPASATLVLVSVSDATHDSAWSDSLGPNRDSTSVADVPR